MLNTIKKWDLWMGFWTLWNIAFFTKNLIEGDLTFMIVFAVLAIIDAAMWKVLRPKMAAQFERRDKIAAEMAEARAKWLS